MRMWIVGGVALAALVLASCGQGGEGTAGDVPATPPTEEERQAAEAEPIYFDPALTRPNCPARVDVAQYPGPELAGVRLGMTRAEALAVAYCERRDFHVQTSDQYLGVNTRGEVLGPQTITLQDGTRDQCTFDEGTAFAGMHGQRCAIGAWSIEGGTQTIHIATPGRPGQERVMGIWRSQTFKENPPTFDATVASLIERFGQPSLRQDMSEYDLARHPEDSTHSMLYWAYNTAGAAISAANPQLQCANNLKASYDGRQSWADNCGLTIVAKVTRASANRDLAASYDVGMMNQQVMYRFGEAMEQHYVQIEEAARREALERAKGASAPDL